MERLQKILSHAGVASRRASEQLMLEGRVTVNGVTARELGTKADPARDDIRVDGRRVKFVERHRYVLLNKPRGYVSTRSDPQRRPTVIDLLHGIREYLYPVGRLDFDSEGLLLLTNDGDLTSRLTHPRHEVARVYEAQVLGVPDARDLERLRQGVVVDGRKTEPADVELSRHSSRRAALSPSRSERDGESARGPGWGLGRRDRGGAPRAIRKRLARAADATATLSITLREGRNRQVKKMGDAIGHPVTHLRRVAIGPIRDSRLKPGQWRELTPEEVRWLRDAAAGQAKHHGGHRGHGGSNR